MADYVLDTHSAVFALAAPTKLGRGAIAVLRRVNAGRDHAWIPAAAVAEIIMLRELGRLDIGLPQLKASLEATRSFQLLPLDLRQLDIFSTLGAIREPFDRFIVAAARSLDAKLVTKDVALAESGLIETIWS